MSKCASRAHNSDVGWFVTQDFPGNSDCRRKTVESLLPRPNACAKTHMHTETHTQYSTPNTSTRASRAHNSDVGWFVTQDFPGSSDCRRKTVESLLSRPNACAKTHMQTKKHTHEIPHPNTNTHTSRDNNKEVGCFIHQVFPGNSDCQRKTEKHIQS